MELLQRTASVPGGRGQWNSFNAVSRCLGAVGCGTPAMHCLTVWGQWASELLQHTTLLPRDSPQCNSFNALPHRLGTVGGGTLAMRGPTSWGDGDSCRRGGRRQKKKELLHALPQCLEGVGSGTPAMHRLTVWRQWAVELLQRTA